MLGTEQLATYERSRRDACLSRRISLGLFRHYHRYVDIWLWSIEI